MKAFLLVCMMGVMLLRVQAFVHPGGLHTVSDLNRMKTNVLAGNHPWIDDWNALLADSQAQSSYTPAPTGDMGLNRQRADADAHAAYLNTIRWYISGDVSFANTATNILNKWSGAVNQVPSNVGLVGLPIMSFALAGELLRAYSGWTAADFAAYTNMMETYLYPACNAYVTNQPCSFAHWTSWDGPNNAAIGAIGVLCDDTNKYNQAVAFFQSGVGTGAISNAVPYLYGSIGQPEEVGRDQEHCTLGIADMGVLCQVAWNQGLDLYGYANNRLLAGVEYIAQYNLSHDVPYTALSDCAGDNLWYISDNGRGRIDDRPVYEMFYNHYAVLQGVSAPNTKAMAQLHRPEHGSADHFGYGTLTFTLSGPASPYPATPLPQTPVGLLAQAGISQVTINWTPAAGDLAQGYTVLRSTTSGGPYSPIASWSANTYPSYVDSGVVNGTKYYYVVAAVNQSGVSAISSEVSATPTAITALPAGWTQRDVGVVTNAGSVQYASVGNNTFIISGSGTGIGGTGDGGFNYTYRLATNDFTMIARLMVNSADQMGLMMRGSLATNAAEVQFFMANNARQSVFAVRSSNGGNLNHYNSGDQFTYLPAWYRLSRSGNNFTAYQSDDGINWTAVQTVSVSAIPTSGYYVGLAINLGGAAFDNVVWTNSANPMNFAPPAAPAGLNAAAVSGTQVSLAWSPVTNATGYNLKRSTVNGSGYSLIASNIQAAGYLDSGASSSTPYYYVVSAINGGGESTNSSQATATTPAASAPAAPASVFATPGPAQILLSWSGSVGASSYNIKRSTDGGATYSPVASGLIANFTDTDVTNGQTYFYIVTAVNGLGESADSTPVSAMLLHKLTGTIIGTPGSWSNLGNTISNCFDKSLNTFFDGPDASGDWAGLDFGAGVSNVIGWIQYCPRATFASRMVGGVFQGANDSAFSSPVTLAAVSATPVYSTMNSLPVSVTNAFRYVRYLGPANGFCNVAELEFDGRSGLPLPAAPLDLTASSGDGQVVLNWTSSVNATGYNVKRSTTNAGSYSLVASVASQSLTNTGLSNGTLYYFVVSGTNAAGESANSLQVSARAIASSAPQLISSVSATQLELGWPQDHTGWILLAQTNTVGDGLGTNWVPVAASSGTNQLAIPVDANQGSVFFRLVSP